MKILLIAETLNDTGVGDYTTESHYFRLLVENDPARIDLLRSAAGQSLCYGYRNVIDEMSIGQFPEIERALHRIATVIGLETHPSQRSDPDWARLSEARISLEQVSQYMGWDRVVIVKYYDYEFEKS